MRRFLGSILALLVLAVGVACSKGTPQYIQTCDQLVDAPWQNAKIAREEVSDRAAGQLTGQVRTAVGDRWAGWWLSLEGSKTALNIGIVDPTRKDRAAVQRMNSGVPKLRYAVVIVDAPRTRKELVALREATAGLLAKIVPSGVQASLTFRADTGQVVVELPRGYEDRAQELVDRSPECAVEVVFRGEQAVAG